MNVSWKDFFIGAFVGFLLGVFVFISNTNEYKKIMGDDGGYSVVINGRFYSLVEMSQNK